MNYAELMSKLSCRLSSDNLVLAIVICSQSTAKQYDNFAATYQAEYQIGVVKRAIRTLSSQQSFFDSRLRTQCARRGKHELDKQQLMLTHLIQQLIIHFVNS